uniref:Uncharacterized protein n=1 Tax=Fagus sylvatica TaxID=28930 RepID=A0A2N9I7F2_FAGSY
MMSKKRLGGRRPHWPNHGKSCVIFPFFPPTTPKPELAVPTLEINGMSYFDLLHWRRLWEPHFPEFWHERGAISELPSSAKHGEPRKLELPSIQSSNHLNHWIDRRSIYKTLKDRHHWRLHALSRATGVLGLAAHAPPRAAEPPRSPKSFVPGIYSDQDHHQRIDRPPDLLLYGGKTSIEEIMRLHAPETVPATMLHALPAPPHLLKPRSKAFRAPIKDPGHMVRLLGGPSTVCRWNRRHRISHAPPRAGNAPGRFHPRAQHVFTRALAHVCTLPAHAWCHVSLHGFTASALIANHHATSSCHVAEKN